MLSSIWLFIKRESLDRLFVIIVILIVISGFILAVAEPDIGLADAMWWSIVTVTTVGYGDISPATPAGRVLAIALMFSGIGLLAAFSATIASVFVDRKIKDDLGMTIHKQRDHIIICEWNYQTKDIVRDLRNDEQTADVPIILIADIERKPMTDSNLYFIQGEVTDEALAEASVDSARTVVILGDVNLSPTARDAKAVLTVLAVESINPDAYTIVEIAKRSNVQHARNAKADEVIVVGQISSGLIARTALNHGLGRVTTEILRSGEGSEMYKVAVPASMYDRTFLDVFTEIKREGKGVAFAVYREDEKQHVNPPNDYRMREDD